MFALLLAGIREAQARGIAHVKLLTLTVPPRLVVPIEWVRFGSHWRSELSGDTTEVAPNSSQAYRYIAMCFNRFQTEARRRWDYEYFRVVEEGSALPYRDRTGKTRVGSERVHYHLLVMSRDYMPQAELSKLARAAGLGYVVDIRARRSETKAAGYLAAYAAKDGGLGVPARMRFFVMSRGWAKASRAEVAALTQARRDARREAGGSVTYVSDQEASDLAETDPDLLDLRAAGGPERSASARPLPDGTQAAQGDLKAAA